jgi:DNA-binding LacI/PurR family transcriptional regulator
MTSVPNPSGGARLDDVAEAAGVHVSTVSRVLNGASDLRVRQETRERVLEAARTLGYRPNAVARGLRMSATRTLGMLVPSLRNPVYSEITRGAFEQAWNRGYVVLLAEDTGEESTAIAAERLVAEGRIDGLLIASARPGSPSQRLLMDGTVPCAFVNRRVPGASLNISMREEDAGACAARHLLGLGHVRLAHVAGPLELDTAARRAAGFRRACREAGRRPAVVADSFDEAGGLRAVEELLRKPKPPTGVFASNLAQAIGVLAGLRRAGVRVPDDLSVVTYDDDPSVEYLDVPLTTVRMPLFELGVAAADALIDRVQGGSGREVVVDEAPELIVRASTSRPPAAAG